MPTPATEDHSDALVETDNNSDPDILEAEGLAEARGTDAPGVSAAAAPAFSVSDVKWNPSDDEQPDYRHLGNGHSGARFDMTGDDLEALIAFNDFMPLSGRLVFALRGTAITGTSPQENVASVSLQDQRPDHRRYRCVIGVLDRVSKRLWAFPGSTVPNASAVHLCYRRHLSGGQLVGNILPTGCYTYTIGTHQAGNSLEIMGALRLAQAATGASRVLVLRSLTDVVYDRHDFWHATAPGDNIHPGRHNDRFSSEGCLTIPGSYDRGTRRHGGVWAAFRTALGLSLDGTHHDDGLQFSCLILTGLDAATASALRVSGDVRVAAIAGPALRRLRHGSTGDTVARLQAALGLAPDPAKLLGPVSRNALTNLQKTKLGWADGIYSPQMDADLGLGVFAPPIA